MPRVARCDLNRLDAVEVTASGALRVPARLARVGVLTYTDGEGNTWGELVPAETLFATDSMDSARGMALVDLHPGGSAVTPENRKALSVGHVSDAVTRDGDYLSAPVYVTDAAEIALVQGGKRRDVSCGYTCDLEETPGVYDGQHYQRIQRGRVYNHLGLGPEGWGRAGTEVSLRLDGGGATARLDASRAQTDSTTAGRAGREVRADHKRTGMKYTLKVRGKVFHIDTDAPDEAVMKDAQCEVDSVASAADDLTAKLKAAEAALTEALKSVAMLKAQHAVKEAEEPKAIVEADVPEVIADSIVAKRLAVLDVAREDARLVLGADVKLDGLKVREIRAKVIAHAVPGMKLDGLSDDAIAGMCAGFVAERRAKAAKRTDGDRKVADVLVTDERQAEDVAREDAGDEDPAETQRKAVKSWGKAPLGTAKGK